MNDDTTITLQRGIVRQLADMRDKGESYSDVVSRILEFYKKNLPEVKA